MKTRRRAFTLIECLVVLLVMTMAMGTIVLSLHTMFETNQHVHGALEYRQQLHRFATQLRDDVHRTKSIEIKAAEDAASGGTELLLVKDLLVNEMEQQIVYRLQPDRIERIVREGDATVHRDSYSVQPRAGSSWQMVRERPVPLISVELAMPAARSSQELVTTRPLRIAAAAMTVPYTTPGS